MGITEGSCCMAVTPMSLSSHSWSAIIIYLQCLKVRLSGNRVLGWCSSIHQTDLWHPCREISPHSYSGSALGSILHHDLRAPASLIGSVLQKEGICSLQWSPDGERLASGSTEGVLSIWDSSIAGCTGMRSPVTAMKQPSAVKVPIFLLITVEYSSKSISASVKVASSFRRWGGVPGRETQSLLEVDIKMESLESGMPWLGHVRPLPTQIHRCIESWRVAEWQFTGSLLMGVIADLFAAMGWKKEMSGYRTRSAPAPYSLLVLGLSIAQPHITAHRLEYIKM